MPPYLNLEYFYYQFFSLFKKSYLFIIGLDWVKIFGYVKTIAIFVIIIAIAGIVYNLIGIARVQKSKNVKYKI